ncbi:aromatic ring-hydroxylating dioxygenase subunit alpha [Cupriavidus lacunae]|nr:aromatic ring-hydroxylating dioxygenase subunit alpha [Cupriavidus lacunae]
MSWLRNTWYAVAWSDEVESTPFGRRILNDAIVFFRDGAGRLAAIGGRCPHRFAPLAMGKIVDDTLECPYHGLRFDKSGTCVHNPHGGGRIPMNARVPKYRIAERWGLVWLWPGDPDAADEDKIPDLSHLLRDDLGHVRGYMGMQANYMLGVDNLIDLSHAQFVHGDRLMSNNFDDAKVAVEQNGNDVTNRLSIPNSSVPPALRSRVPAEIDVVDYWLDSTWRVPSVVTNDVGITLPGRPREEGQRSFGVHIVTPETERSSHYLFAHSRNYAVGDPLIDEKIREWQRVGFSEQDKPIIEATARMMGEETDPLALRPVLLPTDAAAVRARRLLSKLIDEETKACGEVSIPLDAVRRTLSG